MTSTYSDLTSILLLNKDACEKSKANLAPLGLAETNRTSHKVKCSADRDRKTQL